MRFKKIGSIFLTAALLLSMLPVIGSAENTEIFKVGVEAMTAASTVSDSPIIYNQGEEITVKLRASQNTGITSLKLIVDYDETVLEPVADKFLATGLFSAEDKLTAHATSAGDGYFMFYSDSYPDVKDAEGVFAIITFTAKQTCAADVAITVRPFSNGSCVKNTLSGIEVVPFATESQTFSIHRIDTEAGIVTAPTCTEQGYTTYTCADCKEAVVGNIVAEKGHDYSASAVTENLVAPTCTVDGYYEHVIYCKTENCGIELSRTPGVIPMLGHTAGEAVVENRVEATCTAKGSYDSVIYCTAEGCGAELSRETIEIPMVEHALVHHEAQEATHTQIGWDAYDTCENCEYTTYVEIPMIPYKTGDVTGDEEVTDADAIYLLYATFNAEKYPLNQEADYNKDGEVTDADAIYLLYATFNPEKYPLA